jgi:hypothetical protein
MQQYFFSIITLIFLLFSYSLGYSFELTMSPKLLLDTKNNEYPDYPREHSNHLLNIHLGLLGYHDYEQHRNYSNNCFSYNCTNFGINIKFNL